MNDAYSTTILAVCALLLLRNSVVFKAHMRRLDVIHNKNLNDIATDEGDSLECLRRIDARYSELDGSWLAQMLDLRRWTYAQFFPKEPQ